MSILSWKAEILCTYEKRIETLKAEFSKVKYLTADIMLCLYHVLSRVAIEDADRQTWLPHLESLGTHCAGV